MALPFNISEREIRVLGTITLTTGETFDLSPDNIMRYSVSERAASDGFALGETQSATYSLEFANSDRRFTASELDGAEVSMRAVLYGDRVIYPAAFGVWKVSTSDISEQSATTSVSGGDVLEFEFEDEFTELMQQLAASSGETHGTLLKYVCDQAGVTLSTTEFLNSDAVLTGKEKWPDKATLRDVVSYIAAAAGGFARIARDGSLEIVSYADTENVGTITADTYITLTEGEGSTFDFQQISVKYIGEDTTAFFPIASGSGSASNTLQVVDNPLFNTAVGSTVGTALSGMYSESLRVEWVGDPTLRIGDTVTVHDISGVDHEIIVNSQTITYDGGIYATTQCQLPKINGTSSGYRPNSAQQAVINNVASNIISRSETAPTEGNYGDLWINSMTGQIFQCSAVASDDVEVPTFSMDDNGNLLYTQSADSPELTMYIDDNGELIYDNVTYGLNIDTDGNIGVVSELTWDEVEDAALVNTVHGLTAKSLTREEFNDYYMRIDADNGVDIGRSDSNSRLVLTNEGVGVKIGGQTFSRFTANYVQFGDYQIRRSTKGALVIKKAREVGEVVSALLMR